MTESGGNQIIAGLKACPLFSGLGRKDLEDIAGLSEMVHIRKAQLLFSEGDVAGAFYVVFRGRIHIYKLSSSGREQTLLTAGPGTCMAEAALFADGKYPAYSAARDDSELVSIDRNRFLKLIETRPQIALNMIALLSDRLRNFARKIEQLSLMGVVPRLAEYIARESRGKSEFTLDISKADLASILGTVPETLSRALAKLKSAGYISEIGDTIKISNYDGLLEIASGYE